MKRPFFLLLAGGILYPQTAMAYVDPGIVSVVFQMLYVAVFGATAAFIFKPWNFLKSLFKKPRTKKQPDSESGSSEQS